MSQIFALPFQPTAFELVWNLMRFESFNDSQIDVNLNPAPVASVRGLFGLPVIDYGGPGQPGVQVTQFGSVSGGYWVMVTCPVSDPTTWDTHTMLTFYISAAFLARVNSVYIQDLENLSVSGYFSNGLPLP